LNIQRILARNLCLGVGSLALALLAGLLSLVLHAGGDATGATAVQGVVWVMATAAVLSFLTQVVLLTWHVLSQAEGGTTKSAPHDSEA